MDNMYRNMPYPGQSYGNQRNMGSMMPSRDFGFPMGHYMNKELVMTIQDCESNCIHMVHHIDGLRDCNNRTTQSHLLLDCADICDLTAKYAARDSHFSKQAAAFCANICEICGNECLKFSDQMSQHCAEVCFECARHCMAFASR